MYCQYYLVYRDVFKLRLPDMMCPSADWTPNARVRRTEKRDCRAAEISRKMSNAGIVANKGAATAKVTRQLEKRQILRHRYRFIDTPDQLTIVRPVLFPAAAARVNDDAGGSRIPHIRQIWTRQIQRPQQMIRSNAE